jgi:hypothetical protein
MMQVKIRMEGGRSSSPRHALRVLGVEPAKEIAVFPLLRETYAKESRIPAQIRRNAAGNKRANADPKGQVDHRN